MNIFIEKIDFKNYNNKMLNIDQNLLINDLKLNWDSRNIIINNNRFDNYINFLNSVRNKYCKYISIILALTNIQFYYHFLSIIENKIVNKFNIIISNDDSIPINIHFTINPIITQFTLSRIFYHNNSKYCLYFIIDLSLQKDVISKLDKLDV